MHSKPATNQTDPHDVFVIEPDVVLAARADNASSTPAHDAMKDRLAALAEIASSVSTGKPAPSVDTTFRATDVDDVPVLAAPSSTGKFAQRVFMLLFAICGAAAVAAWPLYEDAAKQAIASLVPSFALTPQASPQTPAAEQPASTADQASAQAMDQAPATDQAAAQPAQAAAPNAAAPPADDPAQVQSMARDIASMGQQIEQLKASIEQLRSGQEQMSREIAKNSEAKASEVGVSTPTPRPRIPAPPPRSATAPVPKPKPAHASSPPPGYKPSPAFLATSPVYPAAPATASTSPPAAPAAMPPPYQPQPQTAVEPDGEPVVRPPMPVR
jgi:hypothetical protein